MVLAKDSNNSWSTVGTGSGLWKGTEEAWSEGVANGTIRPNTVGIITDDQNYGSTVNKIETGNMNAVTSNIVSTNCVKIKNIDIVQKTEHTLHFIAPFQFVLSVLNDLTASEVIDLFKSSYGATMGWMGIYNTSYNALKMDGHYTAKWNPDGNGKYWGYLSWHPYGMDITLNYNPNEHKWYLWNAQYSTLVYRENVGTMSPGQTVTVKICDNYWSPFSVGAPTVTCRHASGAFLSNYWLDTNGLSVQFINPLSTTITLNYYIIVSGGNERWVVQGHASTI